MLEEYAGRLSVLSNRWQNLEERIKATEQISATVPIPAINELRYSGRRFFEAWRIACSESITDEDKGAFTTHIVMAEQYFNNADHDLTDALISFYDLRRRQILKLYSVTQGTDIYTRFTYWLDLISEAQEQVKLSRRNRERRMEIYENIQSNILPALEEHYLKIVREEINFKRRDLMRSFFGLIAQVLGALGWVGGMLCLYAEWDKIRPVFSLIAKRL